jgi:hypothetical protein
MFPLHSALMICAFAAYLDQSSEKSCNAPPKPKHILCTAHRQNSYSFGQYPAEEEYDESAVCWRGRLDINGVKVRTKLE